MCNYIISVCLLHALQIGKESNTYLNLRLLTCFLFYFLVPFYKLPSYVFWVDCLFLAPQPPVVKTEMVTISDATQRTEISTKEVPIVQTETKTITYESPQVQWRGDLLHCLNAGFYSNNLQLKISHIREMLFKKLYLLLQLRLSFGYEKLSETYVNRTIFLLKF